MKVYELIMESRYGVAYTAQEFSALNTVSPRNIELAYKVGDVVFDNERGLGATPNNNNVVYAGFAVEMKPSDFLRIATQADRKEDGQKFAQMMRDRVPFGSPTLYIDCNLEEWKDDKPLWIKATGHEGRGRMWAINEINGDSFVPVHVFATGLRARHFSTEFFDKLRKDGITPEDKPINSAPLQAKFGRIFWDGSVE